MKALSLIIIMISSFCLSIKAQDTSTEKKDGQQLSELLKSDYNKFFNLEEKSREKAGENSKIHYKTGGFQEFVDIYISIDKSEKIIGAELKVKREWMKGANLGFAKDVIKPNKYFERLAATSSRRTTEIVKNVPEIDVPTKYPRQPIPDFSKNLPGNVREKFWKFPGRARNGLLKWSGS